MEKKKGKAGYYVLSAVPLVATLFIQAFSGFVWSIIGVVIYSAKLTMNGETEILNDPMALQTQATDYIMQYILYAVIAAQIITLIGGAIWYGILIRKKNENRPIRECVYGRTVLMCVLAGIGLQLIIGFFLQVAGTIFPDAMGAYSELIETVGIGETTWFSFLATVILAPISEEILFRGLTLRFLKHAGVRFAIANVIQALFFGILHMNLVQGIYAFVIGLVLGYVAGKLRTIFLPVLLHLTFNLMGTLLGEIPLDYSSWLVWGLLLIVGFLLLTGAFLLIQKEIKKLGNDSVQVEATADSVSGN